MIRLNPEKLSVEFRHGVNPTQPIIGRCYTLTHSDITADLFLTIGLKYAYDKITYIRDEVLGQWRVHNGYPFLHVYVYVGNYGPIMNQQRNAIFRRELPLALEAIIFGDMKFFGAYPWLNNAPIWIHFDSSDSNLNRFEYWGTPEDYL